MAFKQVNDLSADVTISLGGSNRKTGKQNPKTVEGYYLGKRSVEDSKNKNKTSNIYFLQTSKGNVGVWGKTDMDRKMSAVKPGTMTRITHTGMQATKNGDMYKYSVEVDEDNSIEVSAPSFGSGGTTEEEFQENQESYDSVETDEDDYASQEASQQAALAAAERQAKVKALLAKKK